MDPSWPLVTAAERGFHPLNATGCDSIPGVREFCDVTRYADRGMYLGFFEDERRRVALVQDNRGSFYSRNHPDRVNARAWRDFFYAAGFSQFAQADELWGATDVVLAHPTGHGWGPPEDDSLVDMPEAFLHGLGNLLDERTLRLRRIHFYDCCLRGPDVIVRSARRLESGDRPAHRPLDIRAEPLQAALGRYGSLGRVLRVVLAEPARTPGS
jgi:hypothetical protein